MTDFQLSIKEIHSIWLRKIFTIAIKVTIDYLQVNSSHSQIIEAGKNNNPSGVVSVEYETREGSAKFGHNFEYTHGKLVSQFVAFKCTSVDKMKKKNILRFLYHWTVFLYSTFKNTVTLHSGEMTSFSSCWWILRSEVLNNYGTCSIKDFLISMLWWVYKNWQTTSNVKNKKTLGLV